MAYFDAIQCLQEAVRLDPNKAPYQKLLAQALSKNPHWRKEAEEHFQKAIKLDALDVDSHLGLAEIYDELGMGTRSRKIYQKILELDPGNELAYEKIHGKKKPKGLRGLRNILKKKQD
jgi:Tfp pilus assembly protein PilF